MIKRTMKKCTLQTRQLVCADNSYSEVVYHFNAGSDMDALAIAVYITETGGRIPETIDDVYDDIDRIVDNDELNPDYDEDDLDGHLEGFYDMGLVSVDNDDPDPDNPDIEIGATLKISSGCGYEWGDVPQYTKHDVKTGKISSYDSEVFNFKVEN